MIRVQRFLLIALTMCGVAYGGGSAFAEPRHAQVAGQFYPDDPTELRQLVSEFLQRQPEPIITEKPRALLVPHAGYAYSGLIAASGFRQLQGHRYDAVVVVGFTHEMQFAGASVDASDSYETPLGTIPIDRGAVTFLKTFPGIISNETAHTSGEHSVEVELPFLQVALGSFRLVPILMGGWTLDDARQLATALAALSRRGDYLFIFSTDLSHYHTSHEAEAIDDRTIGALLAETPQAVDRLFEAGAIEACGRGPIATGLFLSQELGYLRRILLTRANSADTMGNPARVVGYAAIGMFDRRAAHEDHLVSPEAGRALVRAAREVLQRSFGDGSPHVTSVVDALVGYPELLRADGLFVTLRTHGQLRGCIGSIQTREPLAKSLAAVTLDAALHDTRFAPLKAEELPSVTVEVSILSQPTPLHTLNDLVPGRDGVILESEDHSGVFLPQVWEETGWTRIEFLRELASQKAGLAPDAWQRAGLSTFRAQVFEEEPFPVEGRPH